MLRVVVARLLFEELRLDEDADDERVCELAGVTLRVLLWLVARWVVFDRDEAVAVFRLRAGVFDTDRLDVEFVLAGVACVVVLLRALCVAVVFRLPVVAGVAVRFLVAVVARVFVFEPLLARVAEAGVLVRVALVPLVFCVARTALLFELLRLLFVVAARLVFERSGDDVARVLAVLRLLVVLARSCPVAVRVAAERILEASVTRAGRAVLRVLWFTSGRYMLTVRLLTVALPGFEVLAICLTATRLFVTRWISLCLGPLTYVWLL